MPAVAPSREQLIKSLIFKSGLVLENQVYHQLFSHFGTQLLPGSKVSHHVQDLSGRHQEVDIYALINGNEGQVYFEPNFNYVGEKPARLVSTKSLNVFLIECKGNSSEGLFLGRKHLESEESAKAFQISFCHRELGARIAASNEINIQTHSPWKFGYHCRNANPIVDSCAFYDVKEKGKPAEKLFEVKDKFFDGMRQIEISAKSIHRDLKDWARSPVCGWSSMNVIPLICTNLPITVMEITGADVNLKNYKWAFAVHSPEPEQHYDPAAPDYRLIPIVSFQYLTEFCDSILGDSILATSAPSLTDEDQYNFSIA